MKASPSSPQAAYFQLMLRNSQHCAGQFLSVQLLWHRMEAHPDDTSSFQHHPSSLHASHVTPLLVGFMGALYSLVYLLLTAGEHLAQDTACSKKKEIRRGGIYKMLKKKNLVAIITINENIEHPL